jgi:hypothetical protein
MTDVQLLKKTNNLGTGKILVKCIEWLTDEIYMAQLYVLSLQSEEIISTYYDYKLQLSRLYTRRVYNRFKETYK